MAHVGKNVDGQKSSLIDVEMAKQYYSVERWSAENLMKPTDSVLDDGNHKDGSQYDAGETKNQIAAKIKDLVDQSVRETLGMGLDELKTKLNKIDKIEADVEEVVEVVETIRQEMRYGVPLSNK
jgi:hypothetical protein